MYDQYEDRIANVAESLEDAVRLTGELAYSLALIDPPTGNSEASTDFIRKMFRQKQAESPQALNASSNLLAMHPDLTRECLPSVQDQIYVL